MKIFVSLCASVLIAVVIINFLPIHGEEAIYDNTVRLHVIAASDSEEDQTLKLKVRDEVLALVSSNLEGVSDKNTADKIITSLTPDIERCAEEVLDSEGKPSDVTVTFDHEKYPVRYYDDYTLPSGVYKSLKVTINEGAGQNWWCVLFPSVCTADAKKAEDAYVEAGFTPEQYRLIDNGSSGKYKVRFKVLEILSGIFGFDY